MPRNTEVPESDASERGEARVLRSEVLERMHETDALLRSGGSLDPLGQKLAERDVSRRVGEFAQALGVPPLEAPRGVEFLPAGRFLERFVAESSVDGASEADLAALEEKGRSVLGYVGRTGEVVVNGDHEQVYATLVHEELHRWSSPGFREAVGPELDEGTTELLARHLSGEWYIDLPRVEVRYGPDGRAEFLQSRTEVYRDQVRQAEGLAARFGVEALARAYFTGDVKALGDLQQRDKS
jgi:hypothetical protein